MGFVCALSAIQSILSIRFGGWGAWPWHGRHIVKDTRAWTEGIRRHGYGLVVFVTKFAFKELYVNELDRGSRV